MIGALTLDQLRVLVAIEGAGSFSAAGRKLRRVQSAISHTVQSLEEVQGLQLFDRSGRTPRFTETGRVRRLPGSRRRDCPELQRSLPDRSSASRVEREATRSEEEGP